MVSRPDGLMTEVSQMDFGEVEHEKRNAAHCYEKWQQRYVEN